MKSAGNTGGGEGGAGRRGRGREREKKTIGFTAQRHPVATVDDGSVRAGITAFRPNSHFVITPAVIRLPSS